MTILFKYAVLFLMLMVPCFSMAPSCNSVTLLLAPCLDFLKSGALSGFSSEPSQGCCVGVTSISNTVKSKDDRTIACECIQQALSTVGSYYPSRIPLLVKKCGASISLPAIDRKTDCSKK